MADRRVDETRRARWGRRALTVPGAFAFAALAWGLLPVLVPAAALADALRGARGAPALRLALFAPLFGACETGGLLAAGLLGLARPLLGRERERALLYGLQHLWARALLGSARLCYGLSLEVKGEEAAAGAGPLLVFPRHASAADALLPAVLLGHRHGLRLRYVMKRELLADPCLDVVGQRLPNAFVRRGGNASAREVAAVRALAADLGPREGVVLYPEGTRFSPERRARAVERLRASSRPALAERARALRALLPPRLGGALALLEARPDADALFLAHAGLEGARSLREVWRGALTGRRVRVELRRVPAPEIPEGEEARIDWLYTQWERLDRWVAERSPAGAAA